MDYAPKKRLRGKQEVPQDQMETIAGSKPPSQKPKMAKAKARPMKGPRAQQFTDTMNAHMKQNAGAIGLAERVKEKNAKASRLERNHLP